MEWRATSVGEEAPPVMTPYRSPDRTSDRSPPDPHVPAAIRSHTRSRLVLAVLALVLPAALFGLFERHARRLDALGHHGAVADARVVEEEVRRGSTRHAAHVAYAFVVDGRRYTWSVARGEIPFYVGETFPVLYLPEDPSLTRPYVDRTRATAEAASNRAATWKIVLAFSGFFAMFALSSHLRLRRIRAVGRTEWNDPAAYRRRLAGTGGLLLLALCLVTSWHVRDAHLHGEPAWPSLLGFAFTLAVLGSTAAVFLRRWRL